MARGILLLIAIGLLSRCAQVEPLTGGEKDQTAPKIVHQEPEQGTIGFRGNEILLEFDEYVKLKDPRSTITSNPANIRVQAELKEKKMRLFWTEPLYDSTTYVIQLNGAIADNNEGNDSIMQLAFSTGSFIDSLTFSGSVEDAFSGKPMTNVSVGLYPEDSLIVGRTPLYAVRTDKSGNFEFRYLKSNDYRIFAFNDANKNQKPDSDEPIAFLDQTITAGDSLAAPLRMFQTRMKQSLGVKVNAPGSVSVYGIDSLDLDRLTIDGRQPDLFERFSHDSILVELPFSDNVKYLFQYDSLKLEKIVAREDRNAALVISYAGIPVWFAGDTLVFQVNDKISSLDTSRLLVRSENGDTLKSHFHYAFNKIYVAPEGNPGQPINVRFAKGAVMGQSTLSDSLKIQFDSPKKADLTSLTLVMDDFDGEWLVQLMRGQKVYYSTYKAATDSAVLFSKIVPGEYSVRVVQDENRNGKWDNGNYPQHRQPEVLYQFTLTQKLRPNWDVEETLVRP